jgi:hypothetical protein
MPLGLVVFADKSHLDLHGSLLTLPIIFTLSCFNEQSRNSINFWRPMGFIPNLNAGSLTSRYSMMRKRIQPSTSQDEHDCLHAAFSSLRNLFHRGGINVTVMDRDVCVNLGSTLLICCWRQLWKQLIDDSSQFTLDEE